MRRTLSIAGLALAAHVTWAEAPALDWAARVGGPFGDLVRAAATDASGNVYLAGSFGSTVDFDPGPGTLELTGTVADPFLASYDADGALRWADAFIGTNLSDGATAVATEGDGVFVCGDHASTLDMDPGAGSFPLVNPNPSTSNVFCARYAASDGALVWAFTIGSAAVDQATRVALTPGGDLLVVGRFQNTVDFDPGPGVANLTATVNADAFIAQYTPAGAFVRAGSLHQLSTSGASTFDEIGGIAVDPSNGSISLVGTLNGTMDFDLGPGEVLLTADGADPFVARYDATFGLIWAHALESDGNTNRATGAAVGAAGELYVTGYITGTTDFDPDPVGNFLLSGPGGLDPFVARYDVDGAYVWAGVFGGAGTDRPIDLRRGADGHLTVTGDYGGDFDADPGPGVAPLPPPLANWNGFLVRVSPDGALAGAGAFQELVGGANTGIHPNALDLGPDPGRVVVGSFTSEGDFDPGPGTLSLVSAGQADAFFVRLVPGPLFADGFESGDTSAWSSTVP